MTTITSVCAREILDSRGNPTIEVDIRLANGVLGRAAVPSGASTGSHEAVERRDGDYQRYRGLGVQAAVATINNDLSPKLQQVSVMSQTDFDALLLSWDGTSNKSHLGANVILALSMAAAKCAALTHEVPLFHYLRTYHVNHTNDYYLPVPLFNIINGGAHADNGLAIQELMILPLGLTSFADALRCGAEIYYTLKQILRSNHLYTGVGDEGGYTPQISDVRVALDYIVAAIQASGYVPGKDVYLGLDVASTEFYSDGNYLVGSESFNSAQWVEYLLSLANNYPLISIEDGMAEDDYAGWAELTLRLGRNIQLVGDDVFVTNQQLLEQGINHNIANAILIKPNQVGTLSETLAAIAVAQAANYHTVISHRSGETEDTIIADLALATNAQQIKAGAPCRGERVAKYNQLLRYAELLSGNAQYAGPNIISILGAK